MPESPARAEQLVSAESVTGAREPDGEAWAVDEHDAELAAREQAAAVRNKRRRLLAEAEGAQVAAGGLFAGLTLNGITPGAPQRRCPTRGCKAPRWGPC